MDVKKIKNRSILLSFGIFILALTQNAISINYQNQVRYDSAIDYFRIGSIAALGGGLDEQIVWFANPLAFFAMILFAINYRITKILSLFLSLLSLVLAVSFFFWKEILAAESGSMAKIISFGLGYYLWVLSILILTIGIFICLIKDFKVNIKS
ncbi:MAG: hypothetical protein ABI441_00665 [Flavobacterium sp.]